MPSNAAAWITAPRASPLSVQPAPYPVPGSKDLIVRTAAVAINPLEYKIQDYNPAIGGNPIAYPTILGSDLAGTVVSAGSEAGPCLQPGTRIIAHTRGYSTNHPAAGAFQQFVLVPAVSAIPIPESLNFEAAVVLPLATDTAIAGLFLEASLGLPVARLSNPDSTSAPTPTGTTDSDPAPALLLWGGSSSVGCCALQLARAVGYSVYTTSSLHNFSLCYSLGATKVFDRSSPTVEDDLIAELRDRRVVGALDCVGDVEKTVPMCARILAGTAEDGDRGPGETEPNVRKKVVSVLTPPEGEKLGVTGVEAVRLRIPDMHGTDFYQTITSWMARSLADGSLQAKPDPIIVGEGLEAIQTGLDKLRKGVSAAKVVVKI
ncbi:MAG: hypothetical protein Q9227_006550 [Pyrenula ochraceoflavens]